MTSYQSFDPNTEVIGQNLLAFVQNMQSSEIMPVLEEHGLTNIDPNTWYPLQQWLDVLTALSDRSGAMFNFVAIGAAIAQTAFLPPEVERLTFEQVMFGINDYYQMQHRNGDAGSITVEKAGDKHLVLSVEVPYPDDLEYGTAYGFARRFLPPRSDFTVKYDGQTSKREDGGAATLIHITWE